MRFLLYNAANLPLVQWTPTLFNAAKLSALLLLSVAMAAAQPRQKPVHTPLDPVRLRCHGMVLHADPGYRKVWRQWILEPAAMADIPVSTASGAFEQAIPRERQSWRGGLYRCRSQYPHPPDKSRHDRPAPHDLLRHAAQRSG